MITGVCTCSHVHANDTYMGGGPGGSFHTWLLLVLKFEMEVFRSPSVANGTRFWSGKSQARVHVVMHTCACHVVRKTTQNFLSHKNMYTKDTHTHKGTPRLLRKEATTCCRKTMRKKSNRAMAKSKRILTWSCVHKLRRTCVCPRACQPDVPCVHKLRRTCVSGTYTHTTCAVQVELSSAHTVRR